MPRSVAVFVACVLLAAICGSAHGEPTATAVVRGAGLVYLRRGPGTDHQAFRTVAKGARVTVEAVEGSWTKIRTADGESGYVNSAFLETEGGSAPARANNQSGATSPPAAASEPQAEAKPAAVDEPRAPAVVEARAVPAPGRGTEDDMRADVRRLLALTEEMHQQLNGERGAPPPAPFPSGAHDAPGAASTLALTGAGLLIGFLIGTGYGRYQERNRRTRVRF